MSITTTRNAPFGNVIDITHKPKRTQAENIAKAGTEFGKQNDKENNVPTSVNLQSVSIEKAIKYYESNATGELAVLYKNTAKWLRDLMTVDRYEIRKAQEAQKSEAANEVTESTEEVK